jgi:hypothetical protein
MSNCAPTRYLAELNIGRVRYELTDPRMAGFVDNLDLVNGLAERSDGFVWRLKDDSGNATSLRAFDDARVILNISVWENVEALERFVWRTVHKRFYGRRHEWFDKFDGPYFVMWWVEPTHRPSIAEALERLDHLKRNGTSDHAFGWDGVASAVHWKTARCA